MVNNKYNNLTLRTLSALILAPFVVACIYFGSIFFQGIIILMTILMAFEWNGLTHLKPKDETEKPLMKLFWFLFGLGYIGAPTTSLLYLRSLDNGREIVLWLIFVVWATDTGAYFAGKFIGGWKLAPKISPNKTWSGLIGGVLLALAVGYFSLPFIGSKRPDILLGLSALLGGYAQIGDLLESWIKRKFGAKDSGQLIPGHGGILDRVDGIVTTAPKLLLVVFFDNIGIFG